MPKWITAIFVFFLSMSLLTAKARTAEDIMESHIQAMGGKELMRMASSETGPGPYSLYRYARSGGEVILDGVEEVNQRPCYKLVVRTEEGSTACYDIDAETHLIRREILESNIDEPQCRATRITYYKDYKKTRKGYIFPAVINEIILSASDTLPVKAHHTTQGR